MQWDRFIICLIFLYKPEHVTSGVTTYTKCKCVHTQHTCKKLIYYTSKLYSRSRPFPSWQWAGPRRPWLMIGGWRFSAQIIRAVVAGGGGWCGGGHRRGPAAAATAAGTCTCRCCSHCAARYVVGTRDWFTWLSWNNISVFLLVI